MNDSRLKGIAVILFGILLSASSAEMNRTVWQVGAISHLLLSG